MGRSDQWFVYPWNITIQELAKEAKLVKELKKSLPQLDPKKDYE